MEIAVLHDVAEAIVGDITPSDGISKGTSRRRITADQTDTK